MSKNMLSEAILIILIKHCIFYKQIEHNCLRIILENYFNNSNKTLYFLKKLSLAVKEYFKRSDH